MRTLWLLFYVLTYSFIHGRHIVDQDYVANQADLAVEDSKTEASVEEAENTFFRWFTLPRYSKQADGNYCTIDDDHTMCLHQGPSETCAEIAISAGLTDDTRKILLDEHNHYRSKIANGLTSLETFDLNKLDSVYVGQNLFISLSSHQQPADDVQNTFKEAVDSWYDEVTPKPPTPSSPGKPGFNPANIDPFRFDFNTGHYSQVVWAETSELGCGATYYEDTDGWYKNLVVCNYAVGGNFANRPMYLTGPAGSKCPQDTQPNNEGLCE